MVVLKADFVIFSSGCHSDGILVEALTFRLMLFQQVLPGEAMKKTLTEVKLMVATLVDKADEDLDPSVVVFFGVFRIRDEEKILEKDIKSRSKGCLLSTCIFQALR